LPIEQPTGGRGSRRRKGTDLDDAVGRVSVGAAVVAEGRRRCAPAVEAEHVALVARGRRVRGAGEEEARGQQRLQPVGHRRRRHAPLQHHVGVGRRRRRRRWTTGLGLSTRRRRCRCRPPPGAMQEPRNGCRPARDAGEER